MNRVVVTGANGSIGRALMAALPDAQGIDIDDWDVTEPRLNEIEKQPELVFHLAASKDAPEGETDPEKVLRVNALGTANVLARWPSAKVILASTCKACDPETAYGASKLIAERMVLNAGGSVARFHNVIETSGNVFQTWRDTPEDQPIAYTDCVRYFIPISAAVNLLLATSHLPAGRYLTYPAFPRHMSDMARIYYPGRERVEIPRRRGDRIVEPLVADNETYEAIYGWDGIYAVKNPNDPV